MNEVELVEWLRAHSGSGRQFIAGIGDDCAIFRPLPGEDLLFTTDQLIEGVHFIKSMPAGAIGERALARSLSDLAAMGAEPRFCLVSLAIPRARRDKWVKDFFRGLLRLAKRTGTVLAGGDLAHAKQVYCDVMACGAVPRGRALLRSGARPGDALYVSGRLGNSWTRRIKPRLDLAASLRDGATACIDLSDGLSLDLRRLCLASQVAAVVEHVPVARGSSLERALHGGEDYELLFTMPAAAKPLPRTIRIGSIVRDIPGSVLFQGRRLSPRGYDHFAGG